MARGGIASHLPLRQTLTVRPSFKYFSCSRISRETNRISGPGAAAGQLHEKLFTHNGLRMGVVNCCEDAFTLGFAKSREWCGRRIRAVEFARRVWGPEGPACTHPGA